MKRKRSFSTLVVGLCCAWPATAPATIATPWHHALAATVTAMPRTLAATTDTATDVTAAFVANPSFETDKAATLTAVTNAADGLRGYTLPRPSGWEVSGTDVVRLLIDKDCYTDNNFGKATTIAHGETAYYLRMGWSTGATTLQQTLKALPAGKYRLTADIRSAYNGGATSTFRLFAGSEGTTAAFQPGSTGVFATMAWTTDEVVFDVAEAGDVTIGLAMNWVAGGSCVMIDNVRLEQLADTYRPPVTPTEQDVAGPTEGVITDDFVDEATMKQDMLQMLARFMTYTKANYQAAAAPNSADEACGAFKGENTMGSNEQGVRHNADLSMVCAFLAKYGKGRVTLPEGVTWNDVEDLAMKSLVFAYSTHKANRLKVCSDGKYWGSVSKTDNVWESSLWAMSVAYSAFFQWDRLSEAQRGYVRALLKAECNYELERNIPTGYNGDTKAEENGWETNVLAATLGLFPDDELAPRWFDRLRAFAINSYSQADDATDTRVIDPHYDSKTVADYFVGKNLYDDYTLQNHNFFHTSYQNVVIQELGESALALKLFQTALHGTEKWKTNALMHNNDRVMNDVLKWLALADGELAMPNGNDWSLFLYDQITSYSTNACFLRDAEALMLENKAYKMIKARQTTTTDGAWLLRPDVGARRMGVEAHRVMMTWLMHETLTTDDLTPATWQEFNRKYADAKLFESQNVVRAANDHRFATFSWSAGKQSYTGYIAANSVDKNKIIVPYREGNTGNFIGFYDVSGKANNATPVVNGIYRLRGNSFTMNGELNTNDATLNQRFALYATPGNAVVYLDYVRVNATATITQEKGGMMAISTDELTKTKRTLYYADTYRQLDGSTLTTMASNYVNIDNALGIVTGDTKMMAFGDRANNNSVMTSKLYPQYGNTARTVQAGEVADRRTIVYYSNIDAATTKEMASRLTTLKDRVPEGWNGAIVPDPDGTRFLLLANFASAEKCTLKDVSCPLGAPVFTVPTTISNEKSTAVFVAEPNQSVGNTLKLFVSGDDVTAIQAPDDSAAIYLTAAVKAMVSVCATTNGNTTSKAVNVDAGQTVKVYLSGETLVTEAAEGFPTTAEVSLTEGYEDITARTLQNPDFEEDATYGDATGNVTLGTVNYNPCYVNNVPALDAKWNNVLPVNGWTPASTLSGGSNFCRMYSMPYSTTMYCVSPANVGNYAARCAAMLADDSCGVRTLTVLNSWDSGDNAIAQTMRLNAGEYRLLVNMKYECPNQTSNDGRVVIAANGNVNTSLTGIKTDAGTDYRYPDAPNSWQLMVYDFTLQTAQDVRLSLGYNTTTNSGAANNTLLYFDHIRLLRRVPTAVTALRDKPLRGEGRYNLGGQRLQDTGSLPQGIYIINGRKMIKR